MAPGCSLPFPSRQADKKITACPTFSCEMNFHFILEQEEPFFSDLLQFEGVMVGDPLNPLQMLYPKGTDTWAITALFGYPAHCLEWQGLYLSIKAQAALGSVKDFHLAVGMSCRSRKALLKLLLDSSWAAFAVGPKHLIPAAVKSSTIPKHKTCYQSPDELWESGQPSPGLHWFLGARMPRIWNHLCLQCLLSSLEPGAGNSAALQALRMCWVWEGMTILPLFMTLLS